MKDKLDIVESHGYKFKVYSCGPDKVYSLDDLGVTFENIRSIAYWYKREPYKGDGLGIIRYKDGRFLAWSMGHCSCYGPCDRTHCEEFSYQSLLADTKSEYPELYNRIKKWEVK